MAIRTPAAQHCRKQRLGQIRKSTTNLPKVVPVCQVSLRGCGLPRLVAQKSAMPCSGLWPEQGNAPLGLLFPQSGALCGVPVVVPAKGQRGSNAPLWLISPQRVPLQGSHALACNDMQKLAGYLRLPRGTAGGKVAARVRWNYQSQMARATCKTRMRGMPTVNLECRVLW